MEVWDVTDPDSIGRIEGTFNGNNYTFTLITPELREFIAFDRSEFYPVRPVGPVENQNLHALQPANLVIISHPDFLDEAEDLAGFHRSQSDLSVIVARTDQIYNEFASGMADPSALRDFVKMLYDRGSPGNSVRYLLLFGDGSYDYKNRVPLNTNYVPTYQSNESLKPVGSYVTDDYFGIMTDGEGEGSAGSLQIGIGRFPVSDTLQAQAIVSKIKRYSRKNDTILSHWRNRLTFVADDEDSNLHLHQAEESSGICGEKYPVFNIDKIYLDAYQIVSTPSGPRYPDVNEAINEAVDNGCLIINYTGHGGEDAWSGEKVLTIPDIESWTNLDNLPVFVTATCEFSRFDNPQRFSAGEMIIVKPDGGAISIYTTTRLALATSNQRLDTSFFINLMNKDENGEYVKMGDLIRITKNNNRNNENIRNFVLLGDPAQGIAFPENTVRTMEVNGNPAGIQPDTLPGLTRAGIKGEVVDLSGHRLETYDGIIYTTVYDKPWTYRTLANQKKSYEENFQLQNSILFEGEAAVEHGQFSVEFVIPKDVSLPLGFGKISYYTCDDSIDGNGYYDEIVVGGNDPSVDPVNDGPVISIYLDSRDFTGGDVTGPDPLLILDLQDDDGINFIGIGIGHEITAVLDDNWSDVIILNPYFVPELNNYRKGIATFPFSGLSTGFHTLMIRAWDMFNNSSEKSVSFFVWEIPSASFANVKNVPNPFDDETAFMFVPKDATGKVNVQVQIYSVTGLPVKSITRDFTVNEYDQLVILWDGSDDNGKILRAGLYPYRIIFRGENGGYSSTSGKAMIMR
jgi:hypothetical protein